MHKRKFFGLAMIVGTVFASTTLAREPRGEFGWRNADINGDGVISFLEFQERDRSELGTIDADEDGMLSLDEFLQPTRGKSSSKNPSEEFLEKKESLATKRFEEMDTDFDGFVVIAELQDAKFDAVDKNDDGVLSGKELGQGRTFYRTKRKEPQVAKARDDRQLRRKPFRRSWR